MGEIEDFGDSVRIIKEPEIVVNTLSRGTNLNTQELTDEDFSLIIDQANYFQFAVDDIEKRHSHVNFESLASDRAAYKLRDKFDSDVLGYGAGWEYNGSAWVRRTSVNGTKADTLAGSDELLAANKLDITDFGGTDIGAAAEVTSIPLASNGGSGAITSPLALLNRIVRLMDQANVEQEGRWFVADPVFYELLRDENSKLIDNDYAGGSDAGDMLRNGRIMKGMIRGMRPYQSNNLPYIGNGPAINSSTGSETNFGVLVSGHMSAIATAQQLAKTESFRSPTGFADVVRGMHLYGRKILRPECLFTAVYNVA